MSALRNLRPTSNPARELELVSKLFFLTARFQGRPLTSTCSHRSWRIRDRAQRVPDTRHCDRLACNVANHG
jgi:hypothetical protein